VDGRPGSEYRRALAWRRQALKPLSHPLVLVNPSAGRGRALTVRAAVEAYWSQQGVRAEYVTTSSAEEVRRRSAGALDAGYSCVVALGGDGTIHEVINGAAGGGAPVAMLPAGGGNDLARALGLPSDPADAAHALLQSRLRRIDVLRLSTSDGRSCLFAGAGGVGLDAEAALLANTRFRRWPSVLRYAAAALAAYREAAPLRVHLDVDGKRHEFQVHLAAVANTNRPRCPY